MVLLLKPSLMHCVQTNKQLSCLEWYCNWKIPQHHLHRQRMKLRNIQQFKDVSIKTVDILYQIDKICFIALQNIANIFLTMLVVKYTLYFTNNMRKKRNISGLTLYISLHYNFLKSYRVWKLKTVLIRF